MKIKLTVLLLLISLLFSLTSCGEYKPAKDPDKSDGTNTDGDNDSGENTDNSSGSVFSATVMLDGKPYSPGKTKLQVRWTDGKFTYTEKVGKDGTASVEGLDGDYTVTLLNLPDGYTYNPNIYKATNDNRDIKIELIKLLAARGDGDGLYRCKSIGRTGYYRAEFEKKDQVIYYEFTPTKAGIYKIESMVDASADMYNPIMKIFTGSFASKYEQGEKDDGGASNTYTKNFLHQINIADQYIGHTYTFAVRVEGKDPVYPVYVDFNVAYMGTYEEVFASSSLIKPEFNFEDSSRFPEGYVKYLENDIAKFGSTWRDAAVAITATTKVFNEDGYKLNPDDGFYHVYDETKYASSGGWGPILYANITNPLLGSVGDKNNTLHTIEYNGNKALTVSEGTENYKLFIEGFAWMTNADEQHYYFCNKDCECLETNGGGCKESSRCECFTMGSCRPVPDWAYNKKGYADYAVNGRVPVTEELREFLQKFSISERYFADGFGWIETATINHYNYTAFEDSQWLFCCGYYDNGIL